MDPSDPDHWEKAMRSTGNSYLVVMKRIPPCVYTFSLSPVEISVVI
jgi:hypothetical protein